MRSGLIVVFLLGLATPVLAQGNLAPAQDTPAPVQSTPAPVQGTPAPVQGTPVPVQGTPAPVQGTPTIVQGSPAPVQGISAPGEIVIDPYAHSDHGESMRLALPPAGPGRETFLQDMVRFNPRTNEAFIGTRPLGAQEFYNTVGRPDLAVRSAERTRQRTWLIVGSVVTFAAGVASGVVVLGNAQSLGDGKCFAAPQPQVYNDCVDRNHQTTTIGTVLIASGVLIGGGLFTWAMTIPEMVTTPEESAKLALEHDRALAKKYGAPEARLDVLPAIGPGFAGLTARLTF
jgi:hypothetical protein